MLADSKNLVESGDGGENLAIKMTSPAANAVVSVSVVGLRIKLLKILLHNPWAPHQSLRIPLEQLNHKK